ncbi:granulocyte-macrophage colony-stimulating factor receptor subunit alpha-like [Desmodus rotundus]|uniref:granulocyte-macrophage colony-stimulating factor receptor subunit alpha-like n=1 Tax=Desmodus rotundus TaxID=9430 RepID=UPI0039E66554
MQELLLLSEAFGTHGPAGDVNMGFLLGFASLLVVPLSSAHCVDPLPAEENVSPVINMKLDPQKKVLIWNYRRNVTEQECQIDTPPRSSTRQRPQLGDHDAYFCRFPNAVLHRGARLTVNGTADGAAFRCALDFHNAGQEGSGAVNFSCVIYDVQLLNCSWAPGPAAPADVQYQLYCWACRDEDGIECPHYILHSTGARVGCHFDALPEPRPTDTYVFLVNGTSKEAGIQFVDFPPFKAIQMEKLSPPANVTVDYNGSHHVIRWDNPQMRFDLLRSSLCYEVDLQVAGTSSREDPVSQRGQEKNVYVVPGAAGRGEYTVRLRGKTVPSAVWSDWSTTLRLARAGGQRHRCGPGGAAGGGSGVRHLRADVPVYKVAPEADALPARAAGEDGACGKLCALPRDHVGQGRPAAELTGT